MVTNAVRSYPKTIITIGGQRDSGKDTCAKHLVLRHGFTRIGLSDPVCEMVHWMTGLSLEKLKGLNETDRSWRETPNPLVNNRTPREVLIQVGELGRSLNPSTWVNKVLEKARDKGISRLVVPGIRHRHELIAFKLQGARGIYVSSLRSVESDCPTEQTQHLIPLCDHVIHNNGTVVELNYKLDELLAQLLR